MSSPNTIIESGKALLLETITALCHRPDLLRVEFLDSGASLLVQIEAHPNDAKTLVGARGAHISALATLAQLLMFGSHKLVQIMPIESTEGWKVLPNRTFEARPDWPAKMICELAVSLAAAVFPSAKVDVEVKEESSWASRLIIGVSPGQQEATVKRFGAALAILFLPLGTNHGQKIYASVKQKG